MGCACDGVGGGYCFLNENALHPHVKRHFRGADLENNPHLANENMNKTPEPLRQEQLEWYL